MKRSVFFVVALCCCSFIFAQQASNSSTANHENRPLYFGVSVGLTVDWFAPHSDSLSRNAAKIGFIGGINLDVSLNKERIVYFSTGLLFRYLQGELSFTNEYHIMNTSLVVPAVRTYQTMYLTIPTGVKLRTLPSKNCVFSGKLGFYHNFKIGGNQFDNFTYHEPYFITTEKVKNRDAALFAESAYIGLGFEHALGNTARIFANIDYSCQFYYFNRNAKNEFTGTRFRSMVHSLHVVFGVMF